jgi:hypothetical protein
MVSFNQDERGDAVPHIIAVLDANVLFSAPLLHFTF